MWNALEKSKAARAAESPRTQLKNVASDCATHAKNLPTLIKTIKELEATLTTVEARKEHALKCLGAKLAEVKREASVLMGKVDGVEKAYGAGDKDSPPEFTKLLE